LRPLGTVFVVVIGIVIFDPGGALAGAAVADDPLIGVKTKIVSRLRAFEGWFDPSV